MSSFVPLVPSARQSSASWNSLDSAIQPAFNAPVRWTLRLLAWVAFGVASYLAWHSVTETAVAGCTAGSHQGCDLVLTSSWSRWLGIPVAVLGLACYATLAALSVLLGIGSATVNRWITTIFVMLSILAAGVSLWFVGVQIFAIGSYCPYCLVTDTCGITLGVVAIVFAVRSVLAQRGWPESRGAQPGLAALRSAIPGGSGATARPAPTATRFERTSPWLIPAMGGAIPLILLLVGGQILFPSKTFGLEQVALNESIQIGGAKSGEKDSASSAGGSERVALRVPNDGENAVKPSLPPDSTSDSKSDGQAKSASDASASGPDGPKKKRLVKFLGGKLTLDVYEHPVIGSPEAPHIVVEMISYDCPHCRKMFPIMEHALERYGDQVALLIMVQPLDKECNKLITDPAMSHPGSCAVAKLAMGIARVNPGAFASFHEFLMSTKDKPPEMQAALPKAYVLADRDRLRKLTQGDELDKQLESYVDLFGTLQKRSGKQSFGLPVQILGDQVMNGSVEHEEDVFKAWEQNLGVKPK
jgi:uncharacterized membrane protein/thiol-disulfide isomerase/thioredoxin